MTSKEVVKPQPQSVTEEMLDIWKQKGFKLHYVPRLDLENNDEFTISGKNIALLKENKSSTQAYSCPGRWILLEQKNLFQSKVPWISSQDVYFLSLFGIKVKKWLQRRTRTCSNIDPLTETLTKYGHHSRFCINILEVKELFAEMHKFLNLPNEANVRLLHYVEYCYLCKNFYPEWSQTKTWEWLEDTKEDGQHLATGYKTWNILGYDPINYWSTILGFRVVVEL